MCGIAILLTDDDVEAGAVLERMVRRLAHRGPDHAGVVGPLGVPVAAVAADGADVAVAAGAASRPDVATSGRPSRPGGIASASAGDGVACAWLGHRRLSILDCSPAGHQPMAYRDRFWIAYNGEIYNYIELRGELERLGHRFRSNSDTEVLLAGYAEWGSAVLRRLVGMFAFVLVDAQERTAFVARDFFGIKPLFWTRWDGGLAFASEIKALIDLPGVSRRADPVRVFDYLQHARVDDGERTFFADIRQIPAGHAALIRLGVPGGEPRPEPYWTLEPVRRDDLSFDEAARELRERFLDSVRLHLRSDVPVGAALSGGIDSSAVVMAMRELVGPSLELHTFSFITDDPVLGEERWVDLVGGAARAHVHKVYVSPEELADDVDTLIRQQDEPFVSTSIYAQYRVFRLAAEHGIKVMLDGQGADELFGGYPMFFGARFASMLRRGELLPAARLMAAVGKLPGRGTLSLLGGATSNLLPPSIAGRLRGLAGRPLYPDWIRPEWMRRHGLEERALPPRVSHVLADELRRAIVQTSLPSLLRYEDRNSMAHSIESRVPFLTPSLAGFALSLPDDFIIGDDATTKRILRAALRGLVPDTVLDRRDKVGFATPERAWLRSLSPWVDDVLGRPSPAGDVLDLERVRRELAGARRGATPYDFWLWRWLNLIRWAELFDVRF